MPASSLLSPDTSCNSSPTASTRSSTDSKSALPLCRTPGPGTAEQERHRVGQTDKQFQGLLSPLGAPDPTGPQDTRSRRGETGWQSAALSTLRLPPRSPSRPPRAVNSVSLTGHVVEDLPVNFWELAPQDIGASRHVRPESRLRSRDETRA